MRRGNQPSLTPKLIFNLAWTQMKEAPKINGTDFIFHQELVLNLDPKWVHSGVLKIIALKGFCYYYQHSATYMCLTTEPLSSFFCAINCGGTPKISNCIHSFSAPSKSYSQRDDGSERVGQRGREVGRSAGRGRKGGKGLFFNKPESEESPLPKKWQI